MLIESMGAHLHGGHLGAGLEGFRQLCLQSIRHRCRVRGGEAMARPTVHQCSKQSSRLATRLAEMFDQMGGGGFSIGARDTDQPQACGGLLPERRRQLPGPDGH